MIRSLFSKIYASHILIIVIITASIGLVSSHLIVDYLIEAKRAELLREGGELSSFLNRSIDEDQARLPHFLEGMEKLLGLRLWIIDSDNRIVFGHAPRYWQRRMEEHRQSRPHHHGAPKYGHDSVTAAPPTGSDPAANSVPMFSSEPASWIFRGRTAVDPSIVVAIPLSDKPNLNLMLHSPIVGIAKTSAAIEDLMIYAIVGSTILAGIFAIFLSRSLTRPISNITRAAASFANGDYTSRTTATGQDEIGRLGQTFNKMAGALERIEQNRREFFSDITHELKTPLASIQALTESILDGVVTDGGTQRRYLSSILDEVQRMSSLISDLLNLAQLEAGSLNFNYQTVELAEFLQALQAKFQVHIIAKNICLDFTNTTAIQLFKTDPQRLEQILTNLITNALRHAYGDTTITVTAANSADTIIFTVVNYGDGIPAESLPYIWERFYRVDKSRARNLGGSGLGLAITKKLVEGLGGSIEAASQPGATTTFTITLPLNLEQ